MALYFSSLTRSTVVDSSVAIWGTDQPSHVSRRICCCRWLSTLWDTLASSSCSSFRAASGAYRRSATSSARPLVFRARWVRFLTASMARRNSRRSSFSSCFKSPAHLSGWTVWSSRTRTSWVQSVQLSGCSRAFRQQTWQYFEMSVTASVGGCWTVAARASEPRAERAEPTTTAAINRRDVFAVGRNFFVTERGSVEPVGMPHRLYGRPETRISPARAEKIRLLGRGRPQGDST